MLPWNHPALPERARSYENFPLRDKIISTMPIIIGEMHIFAHNNRHYEYKETNYLSQASGDSCCNG